MFTISLVEVFTFCFDLHINVLDFAILLEKCYSVFSQQNPRELAVKKSIFSKNWISLQISLKFSWNEQLHSYFWMILVTFYEIFQNLLDVRGRSILQNTLIIGSDTRFHFCIFFFFFLFYSKVIKSVHNIAPDWIFHFSIIRSLKNTFLKHFK